MGFRKASLLLYFLFFIHLQHHFFHAISRSTTPLLSADPNHDNLPVVHSLESKPDGDAFSGKTAELAVVVHKGGGGGGGGRSFGGGGRSFGGGGRSFGGGGGGRGKGGRGVGVVPFVGGAAGAAGAAHHGGHRSSAGRESASVWLGLSALFGLVFGF